MFILTVIRRRNLQRSGIIPEYFLSDWHNVILICTDKDQSNKDIQPWSISATAMPQFAEANAHHTALLVLTCGLIHVSHVIFTT